MERFVVHFIRASLLWLGAGVSLGLWMAVAPGQALVYRPAHMHANLLGFVSMMIFGVAYHVMPRFAGRPLWSRRAAGLHVLLANAGLALMVGGWLMRVHWSTPGTAALVTGALGSVAGAFLFIVNIWRTVGGGEAVPVRIATAARAARG